VGNKEDSTSKKNNEITGPPAYFINPSKPGIVFFFGVDLSRGILNKKARKGYIQYEFLGIYAS
jgi:hypothetical protein